MTTFVILFSGANQFFGLRYVRFNDHPQEMTRRCIYLGAKPGTAKLTLYGNSQVLILQG